MLFRSASPITVTGLSTGTNGIPVYTCRIRAANGRGLSVFSLPSAPFVVGTALAPSGVTATAGGTGNLSVGIGTAGTENGARTLYWIVRCESSNGGAARGVEQANPTLLTVTGLTGTSKTYDRSTTASTTGSASLVGIISPDVVNLTGTPSFTFTSKNVGSEIGRAHV